MLNGVLIRALANLVLILFLNLVEDPFIDAFDQLIVAKTRRISLVAFIKESLIQSKLVLLL